ncbi:MAG: hypothetical protein ACK4YP_08155 [Myxococcota bacterium]
MNALLPLLVGLADAGSVTVAVPAPPHARLVQAIQLPLVTRRLRHAGGAEVDVRLALDAHRRHHLHAADLVLVFDEYVRVGPVLGFGPFVVAHLDDGHHGPALAKVIRYKHGKGHWKSQGNGGGHGPWDEKHGGKHLTDGHSAASPGHAGKAGRGNAGHGKSRGGKGNGGGNGHGNGKGKK